jgi:hypothetical protein
MLQAPRTQCTPTHQAVVQTSSLHTYDKWQDMNTITSCATRAVPHRVTASCSVATRSESCIPVALAVGTDTSTATVGVTSHCSIGQHTITRTLRMQHAQRLLTCQHLEGWRVVHFRLQILPAHALHTALNLPGGATQATLI